MAIGGRGGGVSDRARPPARPGERDALYDTIDQHMLDKIEVRDRDGNATTYRRTGEAVGGSRVGDRRMTPPGDRRPGGPGGPGGPRRPTGPGVPGGAASGPGRKVGTHGPKIWRNRPLWLRRTVIFGSLGFFLMIVAGMAVLYAATKVPMPDQVSLGQTSRIYYAGGDRELISAGSGVNRKILPNISDISPAARNAVLAAEDHNFYHEPGISTKGILRALLVDLKGGSVSQGGSTITQQYVKNAYLTQDRTFSRKIKEIVISVKLSHKYSKDQVLLDYLNTIYFGRGANGIEVASEQYFGIPAKNLTAAQGAVLAGLIRNPKANDPSKFPDQAQKRWKEVIDEMVAMKWIPSVPAYPTAGSAAGQIHPYSTATTGGTSAQALYIRDEVLNEVEEKTGLTEAQIESQGLQIDTTLDYGKQTSAYSAVNQAIGPYFPKVVNNLRTGLISVDPETGAVLAWYGGSQYGNYGGGDPTYVDSVSTAAIPAGSSFKAVTLLAALKSGVSLDSYFASPNTMTIQAADQKIVVGDGDGADGNYTFSNDEGDAPAAYTDLIDATAASLNTVYVPLGQTVGVNNVIAMAKSLGVTRTGIKDALQPVAGITLGQDSEHATDMMSIYSTIASGGYQNTPHLLDKVVNAQGHVIYSWQTNSTQVLDGNVVRDADVALQAVLKGPGGTAASSALAGGRPAAGKTGTVQGFRSAWFCGYTAKPTDPSAPHEIATCVDMFRGSANVDKDGNPRPGQDLKFPGYSSGVYGGNLPAAIWKNYMNAATQGTPIQQFSGQSGAGTIQDQRSASPTPSATMTTQATAPAFGGLFPTGSSTGGFTIKNPFGGNDNGGGSGGGTDGTTATASPEPSPSYTRRSTIGLPGG